MEKFIASAKRNPESINFFVADATKLTDITDNAYDTAIYLQRVICFIPKENIKEALKESCRILRPDGELIISVLNYDGRKLNRVLSTILTILRKIRKQDLSKQELPWLKLQGKPNWSLFGKNQATVYWFKRREIESLLNDVGYDIIESIEQDDKKTILYFVCKKR